MLGERDVCTAHDEPDDCLAEKTRDLFIDKGTLVWTARHTDTATSHSILRTEVVNHERPNDGSRHVEQADKFY